MSREANLTCPLESAWDEQEGAALTGMNTSENDEKSVRQADDDDDDEDDDEEEERGEYARKPSATSALRTAALTGSARLLPPTNTTSFISNTSSFSSSSSLHPSSSSSPGESQLLPSLSRLTSSVRVEGFLTFLDFAIFSCRSCRG